jgi:predicted methyltransferase
VGRITITGVKCIICRTVAFLKGERNEGQWGIICRRERALKRAVFKV